MQTENTLLVLKLSVKTFHPCQQDTCVVTQLRYRHGAVQITLLIRRLNPPYPSDLLEHSVEKLTLLGFHLNTI